MTHPLFFVTGSRWTILGSNRVQVTAAEKITNSMVAGRERSWNSTLRVPACTESRGEEVQVVRMKVKHEAAMRSCIFWACLAWFTSWALGTRSALASSKILIVFIGGECCVKCLSIYLLHLFHPLISGSSTFQLKSPGWRAKLSIVFCNHGQWCIYWTQELDWGLPVFIKVGKVILIIYI